jgi:hypothetical protein
MTSSATITAWFVMFLIPTIAHAADSDSPSPAEIRKLLHLNGVDNVAETLTPYVVKQLVVNFHRQYPNLSQRADAIIGEITGIYLRNQAEHDHLVEQLVPIYAKYLSKAEVRQLTAFYESAAGRKLVSVTPAIQLESATIGSTWAQAVFPALQAELQAKLRQESLIQ